jgi:hypothetical protein
MSYVNKTKYTPIAVAYTKGRYGKKVYVQEWTDQTTPDKILNVRSKLLPKDCEILEVGVGSRYYSKFKLKYDKYYD